MVVGYRNTIGVTISPYLTASHGSWNKIVKLIAINELRNMLALTGVISPVVRGLALVLSTCLSISLSHKSLITQPADLVQTAPTVNKATLNKLGMPVAEPKARPQ